MPGFDGRFQHTHDGLNGTFLSVSNAKIYQSELQQRAKITTKNRSNHLRYFDK